MEERSPEGGISRLREDDQADLAEDQLLGFWCYVSSASRRQRLPLLSLAHGGRHHLFGRHLKDKIDTNSQMKLLRK